MNTLKFQSSVLSCFVLFLILSISLKAQDPCDEIVDGVEGKRIYEWVKAFEPIGFSGSVLAAKEGKVVVACGVGFADADKRVRNSPSTLFEIASITKSITAVAIMKLAQQKKINLDGSIADYLADVPQAGRAISIRQLLQHTSGLEDLEIEGENIDIDILLSTILRNGLKAPPGTSFSYCNQGYAILSEIIKTQSGMDYLEFCKKEIFEPAGMANTCFTGDKAPANCTVAIGESLFEEKRSALEHPYGSYDLRYRGMGGVVSTVYDLWKFDRALSKDVLLSREEMKTYFTPGLDSYAMGWKLSNEGRERQIANGAVRGFLSCLIRCPETDSIVIVLGNSDKVNPYEMTWDIERLLFGEELRKARPPLAVEKKLQSALVGVYRNESNQELEITIEGLTLSAVIRDAEHDWPSSHEVVCTGNDGGLVLYDPRGTRPMVAVPTPGSKNIETLVIDDVKFHRVEK